MAGHRAQRCGRVVRRGQRELGNRNARPVSQSVGERNIISSSPAFWRPPRLWAVRFLGYLRQRHDLRLRISRPVGLGGIEQLFSANPTVSSRLAGYLEGVDQDIADGIGAPLAEEDGVARAGTGLDMADDQERVVRRSGVHQRIGQLAQRLIGFSPRRWGCGIELHIDVEARQLVQLGRDRRPVLWRRLILPRDFERSTTFRAPCRDIQLQRRFQPAELGGDLVRRPGPDIGDGLGAPCAHGRRSSRQLRDLKTSRPLPWHFFTTVVFALPPDGGARRNPFHDSIEHPGIVGLALPPTSCPGCGRDIP